MSIPVPFADIGKSAQDLLHKDFPSGITKLEIKTTAPNGVSFTVNGNKDSKSGIIHGELKTKYSDPKNGVTFTETWTTSNHLSGQIELENNFAKGLKLDINGSLLPAASQKNAKIGVIYKQASLHTRAHLDIFKTHFSADSVIGKDGFLAGVDVGYDVMDGRVTRYNFAAGFAAPDYTIALHSTSSLTVFSASYYHRVSKTIEAGGKALWDSKSNNSQVHLEVGAKYYLDNTAFVKAKISNNGVLGLGYTQTLRPGVKLTLAGSIDTTRLDENAHKVGLGLVFEA